MAPQHQQSDWGPWFHTLNWARTMCVAQPRKGGWFWNFWVLEGFDQDAQDLPVRPSPSANRLSSGPIVLMEMGLGLQTKLQTQPPPFQLHNMLCVDLCYCGPFDFEN